MRRRTYIVLGAVTVVLFLAVSALLARVFSADGAEGSAITSLIRAEAAGNAGGMVARLKGCRASTACQARVAQDAADLHRPGTVTILDDQPSTGFSLTSTLGTARVAWKVPSSLPIVQCVRVSRAGDALSGLRIELLEISVRIKTDGDCPARF